MSWVRDSAKTVIASSVWPLTFSVATLMSQDGMVVTLLDCDRAAGIRGLGSGDGGIDEGVF
jgi:hypothetical protein